MVLLLLDAFLPVPLESQCAAIVFFLLLCWFSICKFVCASIRLA